MPDRDNEPHREHIADQCFDAAMARAQLRLAQAACCACGVRAETCPTHRESAPVGAEEDA